MMVKCPLVPFTTFLLPLHLLLQGTFHQEEAEQPHRRNTQKPNIMNYLVPPEALYHLPLATLPCLPEQCNYCGKNFSRTSSLSKHMKRGAHLLAPGPAGVEGGFERVFILLLDGISVGRPSKREREKVHPCNVCDKAFKSLSTHNQHKIWQYSGHVFV